MAGRIPHAISLLLGTVEDTTASAIRQRLGPHSINIGQKACSWAERRWPSLRIFLLFCFHDYCFCLVVPGMDKLCNKLMVLRVSVQLTCTNNTHLTFLLLISNLQNVKKYKMRFIITAVQTFH